MTHVAFLLAAAFGFAWVIGSSKITIGVRSWLAGGSDLIDDPRPGSWQDWSLALLECAGCVGFHEGWIYGAVTGQGFVGSVLTGLAVLASNLILATIVDHL